MLHSLLCIIFKILNCDTAVIAPSDDDNSSQYFHYHFYCLSSFHPVPPLSRWNLLSAILDFHLVLPRLVLPFDLNTKLLISQQPNIAQRPFCIQNERQDILYHLYLETIYSKCRAFFRFFRDTLYPIFCVSLICRDMN